MAAALLLAAGSGERLGAGRPKAFVELAGRPMLEWSLAALRAAGIAEIVVALPDGESAPAGARGVRGGASRSASVRAALAEVSADVVLVHDAARPLVDDATIDRVVNEARAGRSAIAALPVVDTLKEVDGDGRIVRTVEREKLWRAQTPQGFPRETIVTAHRRARAEKLSATDDAALCERLGIPVVVVRGSERALKITDDDDFARAEALFRVPE
jgi:2-C-methyl-D-erythritol 4-phosphate cytidylyltransferase